MRNLVYMEDGTATASHTDSTVTTNLKTPMQGARIHTAGLNVTIAGSGVRAMTANFYERALSTNTLAIIPSFAQDDMEAADTAISHYVKTCGTLEGNKAATTGARIDIQFVHSGTDLTTNASFKPFIIWAL